MFVGMFDGSSKRGRGRVRFPGKMPKGFSMKGNMPANQPKKSNTKEEDEWETEEEEDVDDGEAVEKDGNDDEWEDDDEGT